MKVPNPGVVGSNPAGRTSLTRSPTKARSGKPSGRIPFNFTQSYQNSLIETYDPCFETALLASFETPPAAAPQDKGGVSKHGP